MAEIAKRNDIPKVFLTLNPLAIKLALEISVYRTYIPKVFVISHCEDIDDLLEADYEEISDELLTSKLVDVNPRGFMIIENYLPFFRYLLKIWKN